MRDAIVLARLIREVETVPTLQRAYLWGRVWQECARELRLVWNNHMPEPRLHEVDAATLELLNRLGLVSRPTYEGRPDIRSFCLGGLTVRWSDQQGCWIDA